MARADYLAPLTGLRALAALLVLWLHFSQAFGVHAPVPLLPLAARGYLGVDLFFMLSGFIISHVHAERFERGFAWRTYAGFLWHRVARLYPVHLLALAVLAAMVAGAGALGVAVNDPANWRAAHLPWHLLLLHGWGPIASASWNTPSWSISAEWFAYLLFPLALAATRPAGGRLALPAAAALLAGLAAAFLARGWDLPAAWVGPPALLRVAAEFAVGCLIYRHFRAAPAPSLGWDLAAAAAAAAFAAIALTSTNDWWLLAPVAVLVRAAASPAGPLRALLAAAPVVYVGRISYSIYMLHFALLLGLVRLFALAPPPPAAYLPWFAAFALAACGAAALAFRYVEEPARAWLNARRPAAWR